MKEREQGVWVTLARISPTPPLTEFVFRIDVGRCALCLSVVVSELPWRSMVQI